MPEWIDTETGAGPTDREVQQIISAERGHPSSGLRRRWYRPDADVPVLTMDETGLKISRDNGTTAPAVPIVVGTPAGGDLTGTYPNPQFIGSTIDLLVPPGTIWAYAGPSPPAGWLPCNGSVISRTVYASLFAAIGTAYGAGDGSTTFALPNFLGRTLIHESGTHPRGQLGGAETVTAPPHTHDGSHSHGMGDHHHGMNAHTHDMGGHTHPGPSHAHDLNGHHHTVSLAHDHLLAPGAAVASGAITGVHEGALAAVDVSASGHAHDVDLPALAATTTATLGPLPIDGSGLSGTANTGTPSSGATTPPTPTATLGPTVVDTETDSQVFPAVYPSTTVATMMPFGVALYIIRSGA